jgi:hypothetical protein
MKGALVLALCLVVFVSVVAALPPALADIKPDGCTVETYYSQGQGTASKQENGNLVTQTITARRYGQTMSNCGYKEWLQSQTSYGTNHVQWSTSNVGQVKWNLPTEHGTVTFSSWSYSIHDSEGYAPSGGIGYNYAITAFWSVGNPAPGDMDAYWKSANLQSGYYTDSLDVVIQSCISGCSSTTITLVIPYIQA